MRLTSCLLCLAGVAFAVAAHAETAALQSIEVRVVSYNAYLVPVTAPARAQRLEALPAKLSELRPDVVMLQEVWAEADSASLERSFREQGLAHVRRSASARPFAYGGAGLLLASRFPISADTLHGFELGRRPHTPYHLDWIGKKGAQDVRIETPLGPVRFVNTHLQASYATGDYESVRVAQSLELADWLRDDSLPLVLGGDFNARPDWPSCRLLRERAQLRLPPGRWRVDQVLLRDGESMHVEFLDMRRLLHVPVSLSDGSLRRLSDHRAVLMKLRLVQKTRGAPASAPPDGLVTDQAEEVLRANLGRTRRQELASGWALAACLGLGSWGAVRLRRARHRRAKASRWAWLVVLSALASAWLAYFVLGYVPHRRSGIENARAKLNARAGPVVPGITGD